MLSSPWRNTIWLGWLLLAAAATALNFRWEVDYFRSPGPVFYVALLCALPLLLGACALYVRFRTVRVRRWEIPSLAVFCGLAVLFYQPVAALFAALLFTACAGAGLRLTAAIRLAVETSIETVVLGFAFGSALLMPLLFVLGMFHAFYPVLLLPMLLLPCLAFWREALRGWRAVREIAWAAAQTDALRSPMAGVAFFFLAPAACCALAVVLSPSITFDPLCMHLASARTYAAQHVVRPLPSLDYSYYPQGGEVLMALGYALGGLAGTGQAAAQMISPLFWVLFLLLLIAIARRCALSPAASFAGVAGVALLPFVHWTGSNSKNDLVMVFFQAAALYAMLRWSETRQRAWIPAGALFLGAAFSVKHIALFGAAPLLAFFFYAAFRSEGGRGRRIRLAGAFCLVLAASGLYWHVRTFILTGNPVFPEHAVQSVRSVSKHPNPSFGRLARIWEVPWRAHFDGPHAFQSPLPSPVGIALLVFLPLSLLAPGWRDAPGRAARRICLLFCLIYLFYWGAIISDVRYAILPIGLLVLLLLAKAVAFYEGAKPRAVRFSVAGAFAGVMLFGILGIAIIEVNGPELLLFSGRLDSAAYLQRALRTYGSLAWLSRNHAGSKIYSVGNCSRAYAPDPAQFYCVFHVRDQNVPAGYMIVPQGHPDVAGAALAYRDPYFSIYELHSAP